MDKLVILGAQWGDEGKGKIVDLLSEHYDITVRYQGGSNAGHTVVVNGEKFILHLLPTGILHEHVIGVIAQGMVVDLEVLKEEIEELERKGLPVKERLVISDRVHLVMPYHKVLDALFEKKRGIGTTLRGIGPAYMFKYGRKGIRISDLYDEKRFYSLLEENIDFVKNICEKVFCEKFELDVKEIYEKQLSIFNEIKENVKDVFRFLTRTEKSVLFEGAQGTLLDIDMGTYPYVTSSNSSALGLSNGTGLSPKYFSDAYLVGVAKAYLTRVGEGPFPTELKGELGERLRELGGEYGSTTGRPRRCGWLDLVALRYAVEVNGLDALIITKLDVLDSFEEIKVCVAYELDGKVIDYFPASYTDISRVKPVYKTLKGWKKNTKGIRNISELPEGAREYIRLIEEFTGVPVIMLSTGPKREEFVWLREILKTKRSYS
ncbi:adenylosuccinate synthase [Aquifex pyrophilus]